MSATAEPRRRTRLKLGGALLGSGLLVEALTIQWAHPTAFLVFLLLGGTLVLVGIVVSLRSLVSN